MKWLPDVWSRTIPFGSRDRVIWRGFMAGSFGITCCYTKRKSSKTSSNRRVRKGGNSLSCAISWVSDCLWMWEMAKTTTSLARVLEVQRCDERVIIRWDRLIVLAQARDVAGDSVLGHFASFFEGASVGHAARQSTD